MIAKNIKLAIVTAILLIFFTVCYLIAQKVVITSPSINNRETAETYGYSFVNSIKILLKEIVFPLRNQTLLIELINEERLTKDEELYELGLLAEKVLRKEKQEILFSKHEDKTVTINNKPYLFQKYNSNFLAPISGLRAFGNQASYIDYADEKLFFASTNGVFSYIPIDKMGKNEAYAVTIPSNLPDFITDEDFFRPSLTGLRDIFIDDNQFYISYVAMVQDDCYAMAIAVAKLNIEKLEFEYFFKPEKCTPNPPGFETGGRIVNYIDNQFLFSIGSAFGKHQDVETLTGKIIAIDKQSKAYKVIQMGHRNPQGLYYDKENNIIWTSEHGPSGGDELNINIAPGGEQIENYGWPISSYGRPYNTNAEDPYKKSHADYGFIEPLKDFTPSIGPSQIVGLPETFNNVEDRQIFLSSLGGRGGIEWGNQSIQHFIFNDDNQIIEHDIFITYERIRDIIYVESLNKVFISFETTKSFGILEASQ